MIFHPHCPRKFLHDATLAGQVSQLLFPGIVAKRDSYARAGSEGEPVWCMKGPPAREAGQEMRRVLGLISDKMALIP